MTQCETFLLAAGWKREVNLLGEIELTQPSGDWQVQISKGEWCALLEFTDADVETDWGWEARGRYKTISEYADNEWPDMKAEMISLGLLPPPKWECPACGEAGGQPRTIYSRYLYGADADGNRGEWRTDEEECCSRCAPVTQ
jgi:hypothetical protein